MPLDFEKVMQLQSVGERYAYADRETILYALGVGFGRDPLDEKELPFVYEGDLQAVPTMGAIVAWGDKVINQLGINAAMVVHGEQRLTLHRPLPVTADLIADERVVGLYDKGADKGAVIVTEKEVRLFDTNELLATSEVTIFARADGGFGGPKDGAQEPHVLPDRAPDLVHECDTRVDQALLYALSGDRNPLHRDPAVARAVGFPRPILHGLCTYGVCCRAIISTVCNFDASRITGFDVRFSKPVYPGETIVTEIWVDGNVASFRARVKERDAIVINNGKCTLAG